MNKTQPVDQIIEAVLELPGILNMLAEVAGTVTDIIIGDNPFKLEVPGIDAKPQTAQPGIVEPKLKTVRQDIDWSDQFNNPWGWGQVCSWTNSPNSDARTVTSIYVSHVLIKQEFSSQPNKAKTKLIELGDALYGSITVWADNFFDWLEVITTRLWREGVQTVNDPSSSLSMVTGFDGTDSIHLPRKAPIVISSIMGGEIGMDIWTKALSAASLSKTPPAEHIFLRDARRNLNLKDYRRSVLDSSTAAEIGLTQMLDLQLANDSEQTAILVRNKWRQISGLSEALKSYGIQLPSDIANTGLATPRNKAIHNGKIPTENEAKRSLEIAIEVIDMVSPITQLIS